MNELDIKLQDLLAKDQAREVSIEDLHRWLIGSRTKFTFSHQIDQLLVYSNFGPLGIDCDVKNIPYDSSKPLLSQSEETKQAIIELINNHS